MTLSFMISAKLKETLEREAKKENRSLSNYVDTIIRRYLDHAGVEWSEEEED